MGLVGAAGQKSQTVGQGDLEQGAEGKAQAAAEPDGHGCLAELKSRAGNSARQNLHGLALCTDPAFEEPGWSQTVQAIFRSEHLTFACTNQPEGHSEESRGRGQSDCQRRQGLPH